MEYLETYREIPIKMKEEKTSRGVIFVLVGRGNGVSADWSDSDFEAARKGIKMKIDQQYKMIEHNNKRQNRQ